MYKHQQICVKAMDRSQLVRTWSKPFTSTHRYTSCILDVWICLDHRSQWYLDANELSAGLVRPLFKSQAVLATRSCLADTITVDGCKILRQLIGGKDPIIYIHIYIYIIGFQASVWWCRISQPSTISAICSGWIIIVCCFKTLGLTRKITCANGCDLPMNISM